jgi:ADP-ribosylglycohydrolase
MAGRATQERTLGAILGLGIGDALGMPVTGMSADDVRKSYGRIEGYHGRTFTDGAELAPGEFTDETELELCIMETYTSARGHLDRELSRARRQFLARGESRR